MIASCSALFEVINKRNGRISATTNELALIELATHAGVALANTQEREKPALSCCRLDPPSEAAAGVRLVGQSAVRGRRCVPPFAAFCLYRAGRTSCSATKRHR